MGIQTVGRNLGPLCHFVVLGKSLQSLRASVSLCHRQGSLDEMRWWGTNYVCLYHSLYAWCLVYSRCSRNLSSLFLLRWPPICCPSRKSSEVIERVFTVLCYLSLTFSFLKHCRYFLRGQEGSKKIKSACKFQLNSKLSPLRNLYSQRSCRLYQENKATGAAGLGALCN